MKKARIAAWREYYYGRTKRTRADYESWDDYYGGRRPYDTGTPSRPADQGRPSVLEITDEPDPHPDYDPIGDGGNVHDPLDTPLRVRPAAVPNYDPSHQPVNIPPMTGPLPPEGITPAPHARPPYQLPQTTGKTVTTRCVYIVRHGECDDDMPPHRHSGWQQVRLNEVGVATADSLRERFASMRPLQIVSSPLKRALQTGFIIADGDNAVTVTADVRLGPWRIGPLLEGQLESQTESILLDLQRHPDELPPRLSTQDIVESWNEFCARVDAAFADLFDHASVVPTILLSHSWDCQIALSFIERRYGLRVPASGEKPRPGTIIEFRLDMNGRALSLEQSSAEDAA